MARARNIKPGFFKNEDLAECSPWARLCFAGLWTLADREGRLEDRPKRIKGELFAFDTVEVPPLLTELAARGFIQRYAVDGRGLIQIVAFSKHQNPHHREAESALPPPQSPGLLANAIESKPGAVPGLQPIEARGKPEARPGLDPPKTDLAGGSSRADSGFRIPDSGVLVPTVGTAAATRGSRSPPEDGPSVLELVEAGFDKQTAVDFIAHKAKLKAPLTARAWKDHLREAAKAGWSARDAAEKVMAKGWKGFEAKYVTADRPGAKAAAGDVFAGAL